MSDTSRSRRIVMLLLATLTAVMMVAVGPAAGKAEAKSRCTIAKAGGVVAKVCGHKATAKAGGARSEARHH